MLRKAGIFGLSAIAGGLALAVAAGVLFGLGTVLFDAIGR